MSTLDTTVARSPRCRGSVAPAVSRATSPEVLPAASPGFPSGAPRATLVRRRLAVLAALLMLVIVVTVAVGRVGAQAELAEPVAGHTVVTPGDTLWDVAVATAPEGVDPREQLAEIRALNGFESATLSEWTVVLLPAR